MVDTLTCYNENEKCEDCNTSPVTIQHWGELTNNELKKLCNSCLKNVNKVKLNFANVLWVLENLV